MALCDLCLSVPFLSLPSTPLVRSSRAVTSNEEIQQASFSPEPGEDIQNEAEEARGPFGFAFHRDLNGLESSAKSCPLCKIVHAGVRAWLDIWNDAATNDKAFIELRMDDHPIPTHQQLWLTARSNGQQGFCVWAQNPAEESMFYLLTVVGFSVESSQCLDVLYIPIVFNSTKPICSKSSS